MRNKDPDTLSLGACRLMPAPGQIDGGDIPDHGPFTWRADGSRKRLALVRGNGHAFEPGWYRVEACIEVSGHASLFPTLHLSATGNDGQVGVLPVLTASGRRVRCSVVVAIARPTTMLHLDPGPGEHGIVQVALSIAGVTRRMAARAMLAGLGGEAGGTRRRTEAWARFVAAAVMAPHRLGAVLVSHYQHGLLRDGHRLPPPGLALHLRRSAWPVRATTFTMHAADQLSVDPDSDPVRWLSTGPDPKFILPAAELGAPLPAGWYRFRAGFGRDAGAIATPCLYPTCKESGADSAVVALDEPDGEGRVDCVIMIPCETAALRFDPTTRRAAFTLDSVALYRLSRPEALARMLSGIARASSRPLHVVSAAVLAFLRELTASGLAHAAGSLFRQYRNETGQGAVGYANWIRRYDELSALDLEAMREQALALRPGPTISILVPVYETPEQWLRRCIESVIAQAYPEWELCLANDASASPHVRRVLDEYAARDPRIRVVHRPVNGHICEASNSALELAKGEFIALLDHDDELRPHALLEVVAALRRHPGLGLVYSDEDKIDERGRRFDPYFKPDWNPDLLLGQNYVCHFTTIRTSLARAVGGFRRGLEGSQDHDLILRCTERLEPNQVHHVPKILYHWRAIAGSTALHRDAKDYASVAGARAVAQHLERTGTGARVEELPHGHYRVHWPLPEPPPRVSVVVPTRDRVDLLRTCVESILERSSYPDIELLVVDNQSREPGALAYLEGLQARDRVRVFRYDAPFNYSAINNWAVKRASGSVLALVNNDIEVITPGWLEEMVSQALRPDIGAVGAMLYYPDDTIQHAGVVLGVGGVANHAFVGQPKGYPGHGGRARVVQDFSAVTAACLVVRREVYDQVGGLDERLQVAFNDIDFCLRLGRAGYRNLWTPFAELYHHESASRGVEDTPEKRRRFQGEVELMASRWQAVLMQDPAYNPNLTLEAMDFGLAFPPRRP